MEIGESIRQGRAAFPDRVCGRLDEDTSFRDGVADFWPLREAALHAILWIVLVAEEALKRKHLCTPCGKSRGTAPPMRARFWTPNARQHKFDSVFINYVRRASG